VTTYFDIGHRGYHLSKDQDKTLACFRDHTNFKFLFSSHLTKQLTMQDTTQWCSNMTLIFFSWESRGTFEALLFNHNEYICLMKYIKN